MSTDWYGCRIGLTVATLMLCLLAAVPVHSIVDPLQYVDPFIGTGGEGYGCASLFPGPSVPFGNVRLSPDTRLALGPWLPWWHFGGYSYADDTIRAFSHTHMVGSGVLDLGLVGVMPSMEPRPTVGHYSHADESASPAYYGVHMHHGVFAELTATQWIGYHRYTFPAGSDANRWVTLQASYTLDDKACRGASFLYDPSTQIVTGSVTNAGQYSHAGFTLYFAAEFAPSKLKVVEYGTWQNSSFTANGVSGAGCVDNGLAVRFEDETFEFRVAISYISVENALVNLRSGPESFDDAHAAGRASWTTALSSVQITPNGKNDDDVKMLYSSLYHALLAPTNYTESNREYLGFDNKVHIADGFDYYSDMSIWDTHRTQSPLLTLLVPEVQHDILASLLAMCRAGGDMPRWPFVNLYTGGMFGNHAFAVFADAVTKGANLSESDMLAAYGYMYNQATSQCQHNSRNGLQDWLTIGYIPLEADTRSACLTLAYAYDDHSLSVLATALGKTADAELFRSRSKAYRNVFDPQTKFFCPRARNGTFYCESELGRLDVFSKYYVEGDAWHYRFWVPHDLQGLIDLYPSAEDYDHALEEFVGLSELDDSNLLPNPYLWLGNEHDLLSIYQFRDGESIRKWLRKTTPQKYAPSPSSPPGNSDYGTMDAYYVWYALGIYPVTGTGVYAVGIPRFNSITVNRSAGNWVIKCNCCEEEWTGDHSVTLLINNNRIQGTTFPVSLVEAGAVFDFQCT